jgi:hypothetical protein
MGKNIVSTKKSTRDHCSDADGRLAYAQSAAESSNAYTCSFNPRNWPSTGDWLADQEFHDELPLPNKKAQELVAVLVYLRGVSESANTPWLRDKARNAAENLDKFLLMYQIAVC